MPLVSRLSGYRASNKVEVCSLLCLTISGGRHLSRVRTSPLQNQSEDIRQGKPFIVTKNACIIACIIGIQGIMLYRGEPEQAPNTRASGSGVYLFIYRIAGNFRGFRG